MIITGTVVDTEFNVQVAKNGGGTYLGSSLLFKDSNGQVKTKSWAQKIFDNPSFSTNANIIKSLAKGDEFTVEMEKNDAGFWNWLTITKGTTAGAVSSSSGTSSNTGAAKTGSSYASYEERQERFALDKAKFQFEQDKQGLIIKQSCLAQAVAYSKGSDVDTDAVIKTAIDFEKYIIGTWSDPDADI